LVCATFATRFFLLPWLGGDRAGELGISDRALIRPAADLETSVQRGVIVTQHA
jgi:hypothetical protein